jgi:hypothetical protein
VQGNHNYAWEVTKLLLRNRGEIPNEDVAASEESSPNSSDYYEEASSFNSHSSRTTDYAEVSDTNLYLSELEDMPTDTESELPGLIREHLWIEIN